MTTSPTTDIQPELLPVIQADREAYADIRGIRDGELRSDIISGYYDVTNGPAYQILARHRLTSTTPTLGGMVMVPREPTEAMLYAAVRLDGPSLSFGEDPEDVAAVWSAMLSAAPASPIPTSVANEGARDFWGGAKGTEARGRLIVQPLALSPALDNTAVEGERAAIVAYLEACAVEADRQADLLSVAGRARAIEACKEEAKAYRNSARMIRDEDHASYRRAAVQTEKAR